MKSWLIIFACLFGFLFAIYGSMHLLGIHGGAAMRDAAEAGRALHEQDAARAALARDIAAELIRQAADNR